MATDPAKIGGGSTIAERESVRKMLREMRQFLQVDDDPTGTPAANTLYKGNIPKAWLSYDGVTPAIRDSFNVSSVTDNGTGDYTPVWDRDFSDRNYAMGHLVGTGNAAGMQLKSAPVVGSVDIQTFKNNVAPPVLVDFAEITLMVMGNQ